MDYTDRQFPLWKTYFAISFAISDYGNVFSKFGRLLYFLMNQLFPSDVCASVRSRSARLGAALEYVYIAFGGNKVPFEGTVLSENLSVWSNRSTRLRSRRVETISYAYAQTIVGESYTDEDVVGEYHIFWLNLFYNFVLGFVDRVNCDAS